MNQAITSRIVLWASLLGTGSQAALLAESTADAPDGWQPAAPREEIRPAFSYEAQGGRNGMGALLIRHDHRPGLDGRWTKTIAVEGGQYYRFQSFRKTTGVPNARQSAVVRLLCRTPGQKVLRDEATGSSSDPLARYVTDVLPGFTPTAEAEYPTDKATDSSGWTEVSEVYRVPSKATRAVVELHLQWARLGQVAWSDVSLRPCSPPTGRKVRLAAAHFRPKEGKTPADKCRLFAPLIEEAARQKADLVVLPETLSYYGTGSTFAQCAEPIPGPCTDYFGSLAQKHNLYIVAGLVERAEHLVYNVAVLLGPDGKVAGKYRKVCLPETRSQPG